MCFKVQDVILIVVLLNGIGIYRCVVKKFLRKMRKSIIYFGILGIKINQIKQGEESNKDLRDNK